MVSARFFADLGNAKFNERGRMDIAKRLFVGSNYEGKIPGEIEPIISEIVNGALIAFGKKPVFTYAGFEKKAVCMYAEEYTTSLWGSFIDSFDESQIVSDKVLNSIGFLVKPHIGYVLGEAYTEVQLNSLVSGCFPIWPSVSGSRNVKIPEQDIAKYRSGSEYDGIISRISEGMAPLVKEDVEIMSRGYEYIESDFP